MATSILSLCPRSQLSSKIIIKLSKIIKIENVKINFEYKLCRSHKSEIAFPQDFVILTKCFWYKNTIYITYIGVEGLSIHDTKGE